MVMAYLNRAVRSTVMIGLIVVLALVGFGIGSAVSTGGHSLGTVHGGCSIPPQYVAALAGDVHLCAAYDSDYLTIEVYDGVAKFGDTPVTYHGHVGDTIITANGVLITVIAITGTARNAPPGSNQATIKLSLPGQDYRGLGTAIGAGLGVIGAVIVGLISRRRRTDEPPPTSAVPPQPN
jgi:hypothetical protein